MNAPNHSSHLAVLREQAHFEYTTKIGCGRYTRAAAKYLHDVVDTRWGLLKKPNHLGGANHWQHHAVDAILWNSGIPGQLQAIDIVSAGESKDAAPGWIADQPRYNPEDWVLSPGDDFVLPAHHCQLGSSLFWLLGAWRRSQYGEPALLDKIDRNCDHFTTKFDGDFLRFMIAMRGKDRGNGDPWQDIGGDIHWPDIEDVLAGAIDHVWAKHGLAVTPTLVGEGANVPTAALREQLLQVSARVFRPRLDRIPFAEIWNEKWMTDGNEQLVRDLAARMHQLLPELPLALDTPYEAAAGDDPTGQVLIAETSRFYGRSVARVCTPQWNRDEPNPRDMGPDCPAILASFEPRGPGATGPDVTDPLSLAHDYIQSSMAASLHGAGRFNYTYHLYHSQPGAFGGLAHGYPDQNRYPDLWDVPNADAIARAFKDVRNGLVPTFSGDTDVPVPPYDEPWIMNTVRPAIAAEYAVPRPNHPTGFPLDDGYAAWVARTQYDADKGVPQADSLSKHLAELAAELDRRAASGG